MELNPRMLEKVNIIPEIKAEAPKLMKEITGVERSIETAPLELPSGMNLESVMPKHKIGRPVPKALPKDFNVEEAIENFNSVTDTATIEQICKSWKQDIDKFTQTFENRNFPEGVELADFHQASINAINSRYNAFIEKFTSMMESNDPVTVETAFLAFEKYIEPITNHWQNAFKKVDNMKEVVSSYNRKALASKINELNTINDAGKVTFEIEESMSELTPSDYERTSAEMIAKLESLATKPIETIGHNVKATTVAYNQQEVHYSASQIENLKERIAKASSFEDFAHVANEIEKLKNDNPKLYQELHLDQAFKNRIESIPSEALNSPAEALESSAQTAAAEINAAKTKTHDVTSIKKNIEALTFQDLESTKFAEINEHLAKLAQSNPEGYNELNQVLSTKMNELISQMI